MKGVEKMSAKSVTKPTENCQDIKPHILSPLLNGLKIVSIESVEINEHCKGLALSLRNKTGNTVRLYLEPNKESTDLILSIHNPM